MDELLVSVGGGATAGPANRRIWTLLKKSDALTSLPARICASGEPSPGETRKLMLALGMVRTPHIIIMDEPTNHMDLPSIKALETALADCPCALLLVSHDTRFLQRLTQTTWHIAQDRETADLFILQTG